MIPERDNPTPSNFSQDPASVDRLPRRIRDLVNEYGSVIVGSILDEYDGPLDREFTSQLEFQLKTWRWRKQEAWLATDYITPRAIESFRRGLANWSR